MKRLERLLVGTLELTFCICFLIMFGLVVTRARPSERGSASAIFTAVFDVGTLVGGPLFGLAIRLGDYRAMWLLAAGLVVVGATAFAWWDHQVEKEPMVV